MLKIGVGLLVLGTGSIFLFYKFQCLKKINNLKILVAKVASKSYKAIRMKDAYALSK